MAEQLANLAKSESVYSTSEVFTGQYWIDGKPIYRRCVNVGQGNGSLIDYNLSSWGIDTCISCKGATIGRALPSLPSNSSYWITLIYESPNIEVRCGQYRTITNDIIAILEYTKS